MSGELVAGVIGLLAALLGAGWWKARQGGKKDQKTDDLLNRQEPPSRETSGREDSSEDLSGARARERDLEKEVEDAEEARDDLPDGDGSGFWERL